MTQYAESSRPERRRPRRTDEVTYRVRVDLLGAEPPIWRLLELSSAMRLDEAHDVLQVAFDWTDSHLHRYSSGGSGYDPQAQLYLCPDDVEEGEDEGVPEQNVRLDEVLVEIGETLQYEYDYGDQWEHILRLDAVVERAADAPRAVCVEGGGAAPPEDSGGIWEHVERYSAGEISPGDFNVADVNSRLAN